MYEGSGGGWRLLHRALFLDWTPAPSWLAHTDEADPPPGRETHTNVGRRQKDWKRPHAQDLPLQTHQHHPLTICLPFILCSPQIPMSEWVLQSHRRTWKCPLVCYVKKTCLFPNNLSVLQYWKRQNELYVFLIFHMWHYWERNIKRGCVDSILLTSTSWITR